jgi:hypothetical protein
MDEIDFKIKIKISNFQKMFTVFGPPPTTIQTDGIFSFFSL